MPPTTPPQMRNSTPPPRVGSPAGLGTGKTYGARPIQPRQIQKSGEKIILNAIDGWGKTTFGAFSEEPMILMAKGETGYDTLLRSGMAPSVPAAVLEDWEDLLAWTDQINDDPQGIKTLVLDSITGIDNMMYKYVCDDQFGGDWWKFNNFDKGYQNSTKELLVLLSKLDRLCTNHGMNIVILCHAETVKCKDPMNEDFDKYAGGVNQKYIWPLLRRWCDCLLFGNFLAVVHKEKGASKAKGIGGEGRVLYTERRDAYDAKNRYNLPPILNLAKTPYDQLWSAIWGEINTNLNK